MTPQWGRGRKPLLAVCRPPPEEDLEVGVGCQRSHYLAKGCFCMGETLVCGEVHGCQGVPGLL